MMKLCAVDGMGMYQLFMAPEIGRYVHHMLQLLSSAVIITFFRYPLLTFMCISMNYKMCQCVALVLKMVAASVPLIIHCHLASRDSVGMQLNFAYCTKVNCVVPPLG